MDQAEAERAALQEMRAERAELAHDWFISVMRAGMIMGPVFMLAAEIRDSPFSGDKSSGDSLRMVGIWLLLTGAFRVLRSALWALGGPAEKLAQDVKALREKTRGQKPSE